MNSKNFFLDPTETHKCWISWASNRYDELSQTEKTFFDLYINAVASGQSPDGRQLSDQQRTQLHQLFGHQRGDILAILASPDEGTL